MSPRAVPLADLCEMDRRNVRPGDPLANELPFVGVENVTRDTGFLNFDTNSRVGNGKSTAFRFDERHVLYSKLRPYLNKVASPDFPGRCSTQLVPLLPRDGVDRDFLAHMLRRGETVKFAVASANGSRMPSVDMKLFMAMPIPFPSFDMQRQIASILNRVAHIERQRHKVADCIGRFAPALFVRMFGNPLENPIGWETRRLDEIADLSVGDPAPQDPEAFAPDGPLFVRMQDVGRGHVNPELAESTDRLDPAWLRENRLRVFPRDSLLIPKSGVSVNLNHRAMLAVDAHVVSHLAIAAPHRSAVDPVYLFWWSVHYDPRGHAQVTTLPSLKLSVLRQAEVPLPPLDLQRRFAAIAKGAARMASRAKAAAGAAAALTEALAARLLEQAP